MKGSIQTEESADTTCFAKALIFLSLGFTISWCSITNWDLGQTQMLVSGFLGIALGARYLLLYTKAAEQEHAFATSQIPR
ncbi:hypothetical protein [Cerasicoccus arenae]|uniref:Uncharacterized protein n=1 Tax=Cerasicoccus arenae TaxID=424488 RepID=A0A8J3GBV0_9BACT|nr:hypothetical protein [Cerasicoccus arenae]MBK1859743.1 hypothetical protein [Cerasicoccus arenae]GHB93550.1 hypothetical protein GCM10007047_06290 [Cerasicoccus arenae]